MREVPSIPVGLEPKLRNVLSAVRESLNAAITNINANSEGLNGIRQWIMPAIEANNDLTIFSQAQINAALESATGADGAAGIAARAVSLTTPNQSFTYDTNGANPSPATSVITATVFNTVGVVYYEFFLNDVSTGTATTSNTYTYTPKSTFTGMPDKLEVQIREDGLDGAIEARDQMTMIGLKAGSHGITVMLSNEAHTLPRSIAGVVTYTGSGTKINVWEGTTALTEDSSSPYANSTFRVTTAATGITPGSITGTGTTTLTYGDANSMTTSPAKIDFTIIAKRQDGTEITISKQQSLSYSQAGATGAGGDAVDIVFVRAASQPATPTASSGTPTAPIIWYTDVASVPVSANPLWASTGFKASALANYTWDTPVRVEGASVAEVTVFTRGVPTSTPTGGTYTFSNPPVLVVPTSTGATWYTSIPSGTTAVYTSRAVVSTSAGNTSAVAITGWTTPVISFQNGADAVLSDLSNDNHTVPTDSSGSNGNFTGCATTMSVFIGSSDDSANWTYAVTKSTGVTCTEAITSRTQTVTAMTTDTGTVTIVASRSGYANQTQVFSISKAKSGVAYQINLSDNSVRKSAAGVLSPTTLTLTASKLDISGVTAYTGRFKIYLNGSATATYTSAADEASKAYTVTATDTTIKCELYLAGGTTTLVDAETVLVVADGATGATGATGTSVYTGTIYQQITTATAPSGGSYNFSTGVLTAPASWTTTPPTTTTTPTWACDYTFSTNTPTTAVTAGTWTNLHIDMVKGADGITGTRTAILDLYQWSNSVPTLFPSGTSTYTWATGQFTNPATLNSWTATPASPTAGQVLYVCHAFFADSLTTATSTVTWSTTVAIPSGSAGNNGNDSSSYALNLSSSVISKSVLNVLTPTSSTASIYKSTGTTSPALYAGRFIIATSPDGTTYTDVYTSSADESSKAYTIPTTAKTIRVRAYLAGGVTTLLDEETITIVSDGSSGIDSVNNIVAVLNNENQSIPADNAGTTGAFSAVSTMSVYNGAIDDSANWTYTKVDSSTTSTISGATTTVTALSADTGTVTITATRSAAAQVNILSGSETFDATWSDATALGNTGVVVATSTIPAPNGALTAKKITANAGLVLFYRKAQTFAASQYSVSTYVYVPTQAGITSWSLSWDFADTTAVTASIPTYYVFDKWVRVEGTATTSASLTFLDWNINMNGAALTAGAVFHVWGAMCKTGVASGKYIPYLAPISKVFTLAKAKAGVAGTPATYVTVTGEQAFKFATGSATPTSTSITLTAALTGGLTTYQWDYWNGTAWATLSGTVNTSTYALAYNNAAFTANSLRVRCISGTAFDEITIVKLYDGATGVNAVSGYLTNETVAVATDSNGNGAVYTSAGGTFKVFNGTTDVTTSTAFTTTAAVSGLTLTIGAATGVYSLAGTWTSDTASFTLTGVYSGTTITKVYKITKSKAGIQGNPGQRIGFLELYIWSAAAPTVFPSGTSTYTWSTGIFTAPATLNGWALVPATAVAGQSLWGISATISNTSTTATDTVTWSSTSPYVVGYAGGNGVSINVVELYQQAASAPALPTGTSYNFSTDTLSGTLGSWVRTMPASSTTPTYMTVCTFTVTAPTTSQTRSVWSTAVIAAQNGSVGSAGVRGPFTTYAPYATAAAWNDAAANSAITNMVGSGGIIIIGDEVTICYPSVAAATYVVTKYASAVGSPATTATWTTRGQVIDGNLMVSGTLSAASLKTSSLTAANAISVVNTSNATRVKMGNLGSSYGLQGWNNANASVFKLDENGLDSKITQNALNLFGCSYHNRIVLEGNYSFTIVGTTSQTVIIPIPSYSLGIYRIKAQVTGYWENSLGNNSSALWREMSMGVYYRNTTATSVSMGVVSESSDTTDATYFPASKVTLQVNATDESAELKLISRATTTGATNFTHYTYIIWAIDNIAYPNLVY